MEKFSGLLQGWNPTTFFSFQKEVEIELFLNLRWNAYFFNIGPAGVHDASIEGF